MKIRLHIIFVFFTFTLFSSNSPVIAAIVYQNFNTGNSFNTSGGFYAGSTVGFGDIASSFSTQSVDYYFTSVEIAVSRPTSNSANDLYVWILTDNSGTPGSVIEGIFYDGAIPPNSAPGIIELTSSTNFVLAANSTYWIAVGRTPAYFTGALPANIIWHYSLGDIGAVWYRNPEEDWAYFSSNIYKGAFRINGTAVQETPIITVYANGPYEVWGGYSDCANYYGCNDPQGYCGYDFIGSANSTSTFNDIGNHLYYIITTYSVVSVDAINLPNGYFTKYLRMGNAHCRDFEYDASDHLIGNLEDYICEDFEEYDRLPGPPDGNYINFGLPINHTCGGGPYMGGIIIFDGYVGDLDRDGDNDGLDLAAYIFGNLEISLNVFAENFGESIQ